MKVWLWFFNEAKKWTEVPAEIDSPNLEQAMKTPFDSRYGDFRTDLFRRRHEALRIERGYRIALENALSGTPEERSAKAEAILTEAGAPGYGSAESVAREIAEMEEKEAQELATAERKAMEQAIREAAAERAAKEAALAELERLRALVIAAGLRLPDAG
jgi:hypothetical protein